MFANKKFGHLLPLYTDDPLPSTCKLQDKQYNVKACQILNPFNALKLVVFTTKKECKQVLVKKFSE